ncbi:hypothetical protein DM860_003500 [Cuscuta australis]|nr:hypothetical protein DM860_003500 [Cuscuta australis]
MEKTKLNLNVPLLSVRTRRINRSHQSERVTRKNPENSLVSSRKQFPQPDCELSEVTDKTVAVPFCWEQVPGKARGDDSSSTTPRLHYHQNISRSQTNATHPPEDHAALLDCLVESMRVKGEFDLERREYPYPDELESLTDSLSSSGCKDPDYLELLDESFMVPAAKAVGWGTEEPKLVKNKSVAVERKPYGMPYYSDYADSAMVENQHKKPHKFWKIFNRLRSKSSSGGSKMKNLEAPTPSIKGPKCQTGNALNRSLNHDRQSYSGPLGKQSHDYQQRFHSRALSGELFKVGKRNIPNHLPQSKSAAASPIRSFTSSHFSDPKKFLGVPRELENFKGAGYLHRNIHTQNTRKGGPDSPVDVVEKTVYVDSVNYVKNPNRETFPSKPKVVKELDNLPTLKYVKTHEMFKDNSERSKNPSQEPAGHKQGSKDLETIHRNKSSNGRNQESSCPPLPKSPTESWLWRTLPSRSTMDQMDKSPRGIINTPTKREVTVKSFDEHHSNRHYFEELVPHGSHLW